MSEPSAAAAGGPARADIDWRAVEGSAEFRELTAARRRFVVPASIFFLAFVLVYLLLAGLAPGLMGTQLIGGMTLGFLLAAAQILMTWIVTILYLRKAAGEFEPLERRAAEQAVQTMDTPGSRAPTQEGTR